MTNYLVAIDESLSSRAAFYSAAFMLNKKSDHLYVTTIVEHVSPDTHFFLLPSTHEQIQTRINRKGKELIKPYLRAAEQLGVNASGILAISNHIGEMIVSLIPQRKISTVVMGRRGMSGIQRFFLGSNSKYVVEHANCNVLIIKEEWGPSSIHVDRRVVVDMEEKERKERIAEITPSEQELKKEKYLSELDLNITHLAEETERMLREKHGEKSKETQDEDRLSTTFTTKEKDQEKQKKIEEKRSEDDKKYKWDFFKEWF